MLAEKLLKQGLGNIASIGKQLAKESLGKTWSRLSVIDVTGGQTAAQQFATVIDHHMQFETVKPAQRAFTALDDSLKHTVSVNTSVMAHHERGQVDIADTATLSVLLTQISPQRHQHRRHKFDKTIVADQFRKLAA